MPKISVIVPAYNAEETIRETVKDILNQTFNDFELIIVNDGSTDKTYDICAAFAKEDLRVSVLNQANGGLSNARNSGIKKAIGDYITLIDSDDRIENYYLEYLFNALIENNADMAVGNTDRVKEGYLPCGGHDYKFEVMNSKTAVGEMLTSRKITVGACNRLVPREWYSKYPFLDGKKYEDLSHSYKIHLLANKVAYVDVPIYHYVMRGGSITGSKIVNYTQCKDYYEAINLCTKGVLDKYPDLIEDASVLKARDYMALFLLIHRCNEKTAKLPYFEKKIKIWFKKYWKKAYSNPKAPKSVKLRALLFRISPKLYERIYYIGIKIKGKAIS